MLEIQTKTEPQFSESSRATHSRYNNLNKLALFRMLNHDCDIHSKLQIMTQNSKNYFTLFKLLDSPTRPSTPQIVGKICSVFGRFSVVSYSLPYNETMMNECIGAHPKDYFVMDLLFGFHI